jgi:hypothetical protein
VIGNLPLKAKSKGGSSACAGALAAALWDEIAPELAGAGGAWLISVWDRLVDSNNNAASVARALTAEQ